MPSKFKKIMIKTYFYRYPFLASDLFSRDIENFGSFFFENISIKEGRTNEKEKMLT